MSTRTTKRTYGWILLGAAVAASFLAGWALRGVPEAPAPAGHEGHDHAAEVEPEFWTCAMHPQIRLPESGLCPICNMDLVPVDTDASGAVGERELTLSDGARRLARIRTVPVERRAVSVEVRTVGKIDYDETRVSDITSYVPGRLERMLVDYTGVTVRRGDPMVEIYSPDLIAAQEELLQAIRARASLERSTVEVVRQMAAATVTAARERLRLWGLLEEQIAEIERRGAAMERVTLNAPMTGVVIEKHANPGSYVATGTPIYTVADLGRVWARLESYESEVAWLRVGQEVEFRTEAYPGTVFRGTIAFIDPVVDPRTRTVDVRVDVPNRDGRLKPEMLVHAVLRARVSGNGAGEAPLVIPATAPLITGKRAVVYVEKPGTEQPTYEGREIELGPRAGEVYVVREGLAEGERVVVEGNFKLDSALQIRAKPSMMLPDGAATRPAPKVEPPLAGLAAEPVRGFIDAYLELQRALAADDLPRTAAAFERVEAALGAAVSLPRHAELHAATVAGRNGRDLASQRAAFRDLSVPAIPLARRARAAIPEGLVVAYCPMAFESGASWLQVGEGIRNPYYGAAMLECGEVTDPLTAPESAGR